jgi:predicted MFS family arabinose efflux permease
MVDEPDAGTDAFIRDGATVLSYGALGAYAFWLYAFGPALALRRAELHFSYAVVGVYSAAWAAGAAVVGLCFAWICRAAGRRSVLWGSALAAIAGAALFTVTRSVALTLAGAAILGLAGTMVQTDTQSVLSDRHGRRRDQALLEANIGAGACAVVAPLCLGFLQATPATWRSAMALPAVALVVLYLVYRRQRLPAPPAGPAGPAAGRRPARLSVACWLLAWLVAIGIGIEFCIVYFGAELLTAATGLSTAAGATAMALFYAGILAGRVGAGVLARQPGRSARLLWASLAVTAAGFGIFWLSRPAVIALCGLLVTGLGVASLFPVSLSLTLAAAPQHTDAANARTQLLGGLVVITAPFLLGGLADRIGLPAAFGVVPFLIALSALLLLAGQAASKRRRPAD